ncbi:IclR family transcriptional regulator [Brevibacterium sediminis]|uniref:IclR family transcriptional regulator n=1 Tax=Brevibacterium sediminis TaxID=1857024 RepID=A0ABQ1M8J1_9MICO|nr:IclR family transcriptional regulator [Brevibacterium sediminis]GGC36671.1 IclR family transcriptional regulator [Brevibacterium sediminis]
MTTQDDAEVPVLAANAGALDRGLAILTYVSSVRSCTVADLAAALDLTRSTTYRLVDKLREQGWLGADGPSGRVSLGPAAARVGAAATGSSLLKDVAVPALRELLRSTQETVSLAIPHDDVMVFIHREQGPRPVAVSAQLGSSRPMHTTSVGRAYLSALPEDEREAMIQRLMDSPQSTLTSRTLGRLRDEIERTRERGWSQDEREFDYSSACCGAAIYDAAGYPVAAISVAGVAERMEGILGQMGPQVRHAAEVITLTTGGTLPQ